MRTRRSLLAAAVPLLIGGCIAEQSPGERPAVSSPTERNDPASPATDQPARDTTTSDCTRGYTVSISPFAPTEQLSLPLRSSQMRLFERLASGGSLEFKTYGGAPIRAERYVEYEGAYYRVDYERTDSEEVPAHRADLSWEKGQDAPADAARVAYSGLPSSDQRALELLIRGPEYSREGLPSEGLSIGDGAAPYPQGADDSALVGAGTRWVEWDGRVYEVSITTETRTTTRRTYDYSASRIADSAAAFRAFVADRYLVPLEDLSSEAQRVLDAAVDAGSDGQYEDCNDPSTGYEALKRRLMDVPDLPDPRDDHWYVAYEAERYLLDIGGWIA